MSTKDKEVKGPRRWFREIRAGNLPYLDNYEKKFVSYLMRADENRIAGRYQDSMNDLEKAAEVLHIAESTVRGTPWDDKTYSAKKLKMIQDRIKRTEETAERDSRYFMSGEKIDKSRVTNEIRRLEEYLKREKFKPKEETTGLEKAFRVPVLILSILGLALGLFFLSSNITGNVISNLTTTSSGIIGALLFIAGLIAVFFLVKR